MFCVDIYSKQNFLFSLLVKIIKDKAIKIINYYWKNIKFIITRIISLPKKELVDNL